MSEVLKRRRHAVNWKAACLGIKKIPFNKRMVCSVCGIKLNSDNWEPSLRCAKRMYCKKCVSERLKTYYNGNKEVRISKAVEWYSKNRGAVLSHRKENRLYYHAKEVRYITAHVHRTWAANTLRSHKFRGHKVLITIVQLEDLAKKTIYCRYCGIRLDWTYRTKNGRMGVSSPSLDRVNNEKILNSENVQIICFRCNAAKWSDTDEGFKGYIRRLYAKLEETC